MSISLIAAAAPQAAINTQNLVDYLQGLFGPLFLGIVGIVAIFFLFSREITRFVQFIVLAILIGVVFAFGLALSAIGTPRRLAGQLFAVTEGFLGPVFFIWLGASINLRALADHPRLVVLALGLTAATILLIEHPSLKFAWPNCAKCWNTSRACGTSVSMRHHDPI